MDIYVISFFYFAVKPENSKNIPKFNVVMCTVIKSAAACDVYTSSAGFLKPLIGKTPVTNVVANIAAPRVVVAGALNKANHLVRQISIPLSKAQQIKIDKLNWGLIDKNNFISSIVKYIDNPGRCYESTISELAAYLLIIILSMNFGISLQKI